MNQNHSSRVDPQNNRKTIITTHLNADFDAMASMLAAQKLYPGAKVVFPGSQEKNLRNFFIQSMAYLYNLTDLKSINFEEVERLVLVDTRREDRIGGLAEMIRNPALEVHIYDHHSAQEGDIRGDLEVLRQAGATVTILTEIIRNRQIDITPEEATIMCLGIYEDTGSFTFSSTTPEDFEAAAWLLAHGANIDLIASLIAREISPEQISYLNDLIQAATKYTINGIEVIVTSIKMDHYLPDFAFLIHKMMKMENANALFALALMESKIHLVARSRSPHVDAGAIASKLGGGGHPAAAAASIKGLTFAQAEQILFRELNQAITPQHQAQQLMSSPPISVTADVSCNHANALLTRYNINALPVTTDTDGKLLGYITRQVIEKAIHHDLGDSPVADYMTTEIEVTAHDAGLNDIQEKIIGNKQRILPVVKQDRMVGVITRTDLLNVLVQQTQMTRDGAPDPHQRAVQGRTRNIVNFMQERLPGRMLDTLHKIGETAQQLMFEAYVVGGFVRDLFLYRKNEDIDVVIEGDGIAFAKAFADQHGARIHTHKAFGTAVIIFNDGFKIDVATARLEYYRSPAALPDVEMGSIKLDLFRRDFTINTLAIYLNPDHFGALIDFFSAQKDIKDKAIRVLHNLSFVEDPTRVFRALRFEQRFGFTIGKLTANLIKNAVKMDFFRRLSGRRVFAELKSIFNEENPTPAVIRMNDFNLLRVIHPTIVLDQGLVDMLNATRSAVAWHKLLFTEDPYLRWALYLMALIHHCDAATSLDICKKMELAPRHHRMVSHDRLEALKCINQMEYRPPRSNSELYHRLKGFRTELILYMIAATDNTAIKRNISLYYNKLRNIRPSINGNDLIAAGLSPGPQFREILDAVLDAKINGTMASRADELRFVEQWIQSR